MKEISVVIPVYNSEDNLEELFRQINVALNDIDHEVIFINDGSRDNSWAVLKLIAAANKNIIAINFRKNFGQDNALMAGIAQASGNYVVIMDDDLQHSPYDILKLHAQCSKGFDVCYAHFDEKNQRIWKNLGSWLNGVVAYWLLQKPKGIYMSPFKIIKSEVAKSLLQYAGPFPYVDGLILDFTSNLTFIEVEHHKAYRGYRDSLGVPEEPDEPAYSEIVEIKDEEGKTFDADELFDEDGEKYDEDRLLKILPNPQDDNFYDDDF